MTPADLLQFAIGCVIMVFGAACVGGHVLRPTPKDRLLLWLGVFALCYGVRALISIPAVGGLAFTRAQGAFIVAGFNYGIQVPAILFAEELYGRGWRGSLRWLMIAAVVYTVGGLALDIATADPGRAPDPALLLLAPGMALVFVIGRVVRYRPNPFPEWRILVGGFAVFFALVLHEHAVVAGLVPWALHLEPIGMLLFIGCLAYIAVSRFFTNQRQLITVEKEMEAARQIQSSILPREVPTVSGVDIAIRYLPLAAVAGDFYDFVSVARGAIAVLVADVSGHGMPAALIASMVKVAFAAETGRTDDPASILQGMNATLCGMFERAYVTAACAILEPADGRIRYALAGHPSPLLVAADGTVQALEERGMFIGMFPLASYTTATVAADRGARLILYTDGVTEAAAPGSDDLFGAERLIAFAGRERRRPAGAFADALLADVSAFARQTTLAHDDVTLVVLDLT